MALIDENLPPVQGAPATRPAMTQAQLLEFTQMNGVNAAVDALVNDGVSPQDAYAMLQRAGIAVDDLAAPEDVAGGASAPAPQVRRADPVIKPTGAVMDTGFIDRLNSAQSQEEFNRMYDALPKVQQHVYDRSYMQDIDPAWASQKAEEFYQMQDERQKLAEDPVKQAQLAERSAKVAERQAVQNDFKIRRQNTIKNIEEILADKDYSSLVGPVDGTLGRAYDAAFNQKMQAKRAKLDRLINIDVLDMTKYLRPISQDELKYLRSLVPGQTQHWEVYQQYLGEKLAMLKAADRAVVNPATNQPLPSEDGRPDPQPQPNVYQQAQQNPAQQLKQSLESGDSVNITQPDGSVLTLKKVTNPDGTISWE